MTLPSCSREHKGDKIIGDKPSCSGNFPSLYERVTGISNQASNLLSHASCPCSLIQPIWPSPCSPGTAFSQQWDIWTCTSQDPSSLLLLHVPVLSAFAAFPCMWHVAAFAAPVGIPPKYSSGIWESWARHESVHLFFTGRSMLSRGSAVIMQSLSHTRYYR